MYHTPAQRTTMRHTPARRAGRPHILTQALVLVPLIAATELLLPPGGTAPGALAAGQAMMPRITVDSKTFVVGLPSRLPAGFVAVTMTGPGQPWTGVSIGRLKPGITQASIIAALRRNDYQHAGLYITSYGGVSRGETMVATFPAGSYVAFDTEQDARGKTTYAYRFFTVTASSGPVPAAPMAMATWRMDDMKFTVPASLPAGLDTVKIVNNDEMDHMAVTAKLARGKTFADMLSYIKKGEKGAPPVDRATFGGLNTIGTKQTAYLTARFTPGAYVIICFVYDPKKHEGHEAEGMVNHFTVR